MPPSWTSSEVVERKNSCRKFSSSMETGDGIPVKQGAPSLSASRLDCRPLELVSERLTPHACVVTTFALTPRSQFLSSQGVSPSAHDQGAFGGSSERGVVIFRLAASTGRLSRLAKEHASSESGRPSKAG